MRSYLLASTAILVASFPAAAQTVIDAARTQGVQTSTIKGGAPDAVRITSTGSVKPAGGTAVTIDSNNAVTNEGVIQITNANGATGISANAGVTGNITNSGAITVDETYESTDIDKDGDLDGPFAVGTGRAGIRTAGAFTGNVVNGATGTITVEGNDSTGVALGGTLTGNFVHDGKTTVLGDRSVAVRTRDVSGNVRLAGTIAATGQDAVAAHVAGNVSGALVVQGAVVATGYRYPTAPSDPSKLDADDKLIGGSALLVEGNIAGGIILAVPPKDTDPNNADEDKDGIDDAKEGAAAVASYGFAPAMVIGAADHAMSIGPVAATGTGFGLVIDGSVVGNGVYAGTSANALQIGGRGGAVSIAGGMSVSGKVEALAVSSNATALRVGALATVPEIRNSGGIAASGTGPGSYVMTAVQIDAGASVSTVRNSGTIKASTADQNGTAIAIVDRSGTVSLIENSGSISASGATALDRNVAIDLSANNGGASIRQTVVANTAAEPAIIGDIRFGSGNDTLDVADGSVKGNTYFGAGANRLLLSGDARYSGNVAFGSGADGINLSGTSSFTGVADFGGGADTLFVGGSAKFSGTLLNAGGLAVTVSSGTLEIGKAASIGSLTVGDKGVLNVVLDKKGGGTMLNVAGAASFAKGSTLALRLASINDAEGRYTVLKAGSLSGVSDLTATNTLLPYLYKGVLSSPATNELAVDITRKTATELGLNRSQASAYDAIYKALGTDDKIGGSFISITDGDAFRNSVGRLLPEHAGGSFEVTSLGSRQMARVLQDPHGPFKDEGNWGYWMTTSVYGTNKAVEDSAGYKVGGWVAAAGLERKTGIGNVGLSAGYVFSQNHGQGNGNEIIGGQYELAAYWRGRWDGLQASARGSWARVDFDSSRRFYGVSGDEKVERVSAAKWTGNLTSLTASVSNEFGGHNFFIRPNASVDYYRLSEDGYTERGGGKAMDLTVASKASDELAVSANLVGGIDFLGFYQGDQNWFRMEVEGGRREIVGGSLGVTRAHFQGGSDFALTPEDRTGGWTGRVRAIGGNSYFRVGGDVGAEQQQSRWVLSVRASLQIGL